MKRNVWFVAAGVAATVLVIVGAVTFSGRGDGFLGAKSGVDRVCAALQQYRAEHGTFPAAYGFIRRDMAHRDHNRVSERDYYHLQSYTAALALYEEGAFNDPHATSGDANGDGRISLLEFVPTEGESRRYLGKGFDEAVRKIKAASTRPLIYAPVNLAQFEKAKAFWLSRGEFRAESWNNSHPILRGMQFTPPVYDACVLISVGPGGSTGGVAAPEMVRGRQRNGRWDLRTVYHIAALRAYFLATRDLNENGLPDLEYNARTQQGEGALTYTVNGKPVDNKLPDPANPDGDGPLVWVLK